MNRFRISSISALVLPMALAAQQPPASQPDPITTSFKLVGGRYAGFLIAAFDSIPANKYGFKPTPAQQTIGYVAQHLEGANYQLCEAFGGPKRQMTARDSLADSIKAMWPKDTLTARLKASFAYCDNALATVNDAKLSDMLQLPPGSGRSTVRARFVLIYVVDLVDHYSQMANYMRLSGMVPPSALPRPTR
jgi:hypothetical protein